MCVERGMGMPSMETGARASTWCGVVVATLALLGMMASPARGQDAARPAPPKMMAMDADPDWEVATVKPSDPSDPAGQHINMRGRQLMLLDTTVGQFLFLG